MSFGIRKQPYHKSFRRKTVEELFTARRRFQNGKSNLRAQKDQWNEEWKRDHAHLKFCWSCGVSGGPNPDDQITMMHALKQRFITTREDCRRAAWVCWREHRAHDEAQGVDVHAKMSAFVDRLIKKVSFV